MLEGGQQVLDLLLNFLLIGELTLQLLELHRVPLVVLDTVPVLPWERLQSAVLLSDDAANLGEVELAARQLLPRLVVAVGVEALHTIQQALHGVVNLGQFIDS